MKRKLETLKYRVEGSLQFPIDMLRYDGAFPADEQQSARILSTFYPNRMVGQGTTSIEIIATFNGAPNFRRWESFGWTVTDTWTGSEWRGFQAATDHVRK